MQEWLPLHIFPESALANSVVTTVWIGVFFVALFNLRLGWVLSGLVVPGYMVPLLIVKPIAAGVVFAEGMITYALVWFYSEFLSARLGWSNLFGRDRFLALVLVGVAVRVALDGWALPALGEWFNQSFNLAFDYRNNLHSFGLIIVSLIANNFWKTGLLRGCVPMATTVGLTWLVVRYGLMEFTNFNINSLAYLYEDVAASILASPKAYIILITTAFIASRMNLVYGWDFSGILIPSLLALQWYQPGKILASFVEAGVIILLAEAALRLPIFHGITMEGARKLLLFFNVSYLYKFVLAYLALWLVPEQKITDLYGFGYLLPTLLAIKMHDKQIVARMTRATLQTSLMAVLVATLLGFAIQWLPNPLVPELPKSAAAPLPPPAASAVGDLVAAVRAEKMYFYATRLAESMTPPLGADLEQFRLGVEALSRYRRHRDESELDEARRWLARVNYRVERIEGRYLLLAETPPRRHWGLYVIDLEADSRLTIEVPAPVDESGSADAGLALFRASGAAALAMAGSARRANADGSADTLTQPRTLFQVFHQSFARRDVLQVRGYTAESIRAAGGREAIAGEPGLAQPESLLWVHATLPRGLDTARLASLVGRFDVRWAASPLASVQRETQREAFAELVLNQGGMRRLLSRSLAAGGVPSAAAERSIEGYLQDWLLADKSRIAAAGSNAYRRPTLEDLLFFDSEIVVPLLRLARDEYRNGAWSGSGLESLGIVGEAADSVGYQVLRYRHRGSGSDYLILAEHDEASPRRHWGTYVLRLGESQPFVLQSPRPLHEVNSFEFALSQFESLKARALLVGGAHPDANQDGSADIVQAHNRGNVFNVFYQAMLRETAEAPLLILQARALGVRRDAPPPDADVVLSDAAGTLDEQRFSPLARALRAGLGEAGLSVALSDGSPATAGYEAAALPQASYLEATRGKEFFVAWVSPVARASYRQQTESRSQQAQFAALGVATREGDLAAELAVADWRAGGLPAEAREMLALYLDSRDIVRISALQRRWPRWRLERVLDLDSRQAFLLLRDGEQRLLGVLNVNARDPSGELHLTQNERRTQVARYIASRSAWLLAEGAP